MPALDVDKKDLRSKSFLMKLGNKEYLTVAGRLYLAHGERELVSVETKELDPDDPDFIIMQARVTVLNQGVLEKINLAATSPDIPESLRTLLIEKLSEQLYGVYYGQASSKRKGGKSAEGTNPREVAETSAVGRALGMAGFGDAESFASYEEVAVAESRRGAATTKTAAKPKGDPPF